MGHPYRQSERTLDPEGVKIREFDIGDVTVEVTWQSHLSGGGAVRLKFVGDENKYGDKIVVVDYRYVLPPALKSGQSKFEEFVADAAKQKFAKFGEDLIVPWDRIYSFRVVERTTNKVKVKWVPKCENS